MRQESRDWDNHQALERNREPAHMTLVPCAGEAAAREGNREASPYFKLLDGEVPLGA